MAPPPTCGQSTESTIQKLLNVLTFAQSLKDPFLCEFVDEFSEEIQLEKNCQTEEFSFNKTLIENLLKSNYVCLAPATQLPGRRQADGGNELRNMLELRHKEQVCYKNFGENRKKRRPIGERWFYFAFSSPIFTLTIFLSLYVSIRILLQAFLIQTRLQLVKEVQIEFCEKNNITLAASNKKQVNLQSSMPKCGPESSLKPLGENLKRLERLNEQMLSLGAVAPSCQISLISLLVFGLIAMLFYLMPAAHLVKCEQLRLDCLAFLLDPVNERRRLKSRIETITSNLTAAAPSPPSLAFALGGGGGGAAQFQPPQPVESCRSARILMIRVLAKVHHFQLTRPIVLNSKWHCDVLTLIRVQLTSFLLISGLAPLIGSLGLLGQEILSRTSERLKLVECYSNAQLAAAASSSQLNKVAQETTRQVAYPNQVLLPEMRADLQENYRDATSWFRYLYLAFVYETRAYFNPSVAVHLLELLLVHLFLPLWSVNWANIFMFGFVHKISWLLQIKSQLESCIELVVLARELSATRSEPPRFHTNELLIVQTNQLDQLILERLTIFFINFELFRRQHKAFHEYSSLIVLQAACLSLVSVFAAYLIILDTQTEFRMSVYYATAFTFGYMNLYLIVSSLAPKLLEKIMRRSVNLLANLAATSGRTTSNLNDSEIVELIRRELLSEEQVLRFSAIHVFELSISYDKLIAFNAYALCGWLLLGRMAS